MKHRRYVAMAIGALMWFAAPVGAQEPSLVTQRSAHGLSQTADRFKAAVLAAGWVTFDDVDHAAAAQRAGLASPARRVLVFGDPKAGTPAMLSHPTLALDLPMRALVWEGEGGVVNLTMSRAEYVAKAVFARHGIVQPEAGVVRVQALFDQFMKAAVE